MYIARSCTAINGDRVSRDQTFIIRTMDCTHAIRKKNETCKKYGWKKNKNEKSTPRNLSGNCCRREVNVKWQVNEREQRWVTGRTRDNKCVALCVCVCMILWLKILVASGPRPLRISLGWRHPPLKSGKSPPEQNRIGYDHQLCAQYNNNNNIKYAAVFLKIVCNVQTPLI